MQVIQITSAFILAAFATTLTQAKSEFRHQKFAIRANTVTASKNGKLDLSKLVAGSNKTPSKLPPKMMAMSTAQSGTNNTQVAKLLSKVRKNSAVPSGLSKRDDPSSSSSSTNVYVPSTVQNDAIPQGLSYNDFINSPYFAQQANDAYDTQFMNQYTKIYKNQKAIYSNPNNNYFLAQYTNWWYNPDVCAAYCEMTNGCMSYDVFFERDPLTNPTDPGADSNPPSVTSVGCNLYSVPLDVAYATDSGAKYGDFQIARAGVNGYQKPFPVLSPYIAGFKGTVQKGGLDNRIAQGSGSLIGPQYAKYNKLILMSTSILTDVGYFKAENCQAVFNKLPGAQSFDTFPIMVGGDPAVLESGRYAGQGCLVFSDKNFPDDVFSDVGQYGTDPLTGKEAWFGHKPVYHFDAL